MYMKFHGCFDLLHQLYALNPILLDPLFAWNRHMYDEFLHHKVFMISIILKTAEN